LKSIFQSNRSKRLADYPKYFEKIFHFIVKFRKYFGFIFFGKDGPNQQLTTKFMKENLIAPMSHFFRAHRTSASRGLVLKSGKVCFGGGMCLYIICRSNF
jgi:hypothetical protein